MSLLLSDSVSEDIQHDIEDAIFSRHKCPSYSHSLSLDTWFICNFKLMLFTDFMIYILDSNKYKWYKFPLDIDKSLRFEYSYFIALTSAFNNNSNILYIFVKHFEETDKALITVNMNTLQCNITNITNIDIDGNNYYGIVISDQFHIIHDSFHMVWNEKQSNFDKYMDLETVHWDSQIIYIKNKGIMLLFDSFKLHGYLLKYKSQNFGTITIEMPYERMNDFGMISCVKDRYIIMFGGEYEYGLLSDDIYIYDIESNAFGLCQIKCPKKGRYKAIVTKYNVIVATGYIRELSMGYPVYDIVQLIASIYLNIDVVYLFSHYRKQHYWTINIDTLLNYINWRCNSLA